MEDNINCIESELELIIQNILNEEGILKDKIEDENANFHYIIEYPKGNAIDLIQPKGKDDLLILGCATEISPDQRQLIKATDAKTRQELNWNIRFIINDFLMDFELYHPDDVLEKFVIIDEIYTDGLTKDRLISTIKKIFKVKLRCIWILGRTFSLNSNYQPKEENPKDNMFI